MKILWLILTLIGAVGAVVLILYLMFYIWSLFVDFRLNKAWLKIFIVAAILTYFLPLGLSPIFFDRYLLWLIPLSMMFLSVSREVTTENFIKEKISLVLISLASLMILFSGLFTVPATHDYLSWNRVRWQALNNLMQESKVQPNQIDGGFEFNGWYLYDSKYEKNPQKSWWWVDKDDYIISFELLNGYEQVKQYSLHKWLPFEPKKILVLRKINHLQQF